mgnify:FL=1
MDKKTIMLVCSAGMSTSMLVQKMKQAADNKNLDIDIMAASSSEADKNIQSQEINVVLLGPQVKYMKTRYADMLEPKGIPFDVINMMDYGTMNGEKVLDHALKMMEEK